MYRSLIGLALAAALFVLAAWAIARFSVSSPQEATLMHGGSLVETGNYLEAIRALEQVAKPGEESHTYLGRAFFRLHLYQSAIREFQKAVQLQPGRAEPHVGLASTYIEVGELQKAVDEATLATRLPQAPAEAWLMLARAQWFQKNLAEAEKAALEAKKTPGFPIVDELLLRIHSANNKREAFELLLNSIAEPTRQIADVAVSFYLQQGEFQKAYEWRNRTERREMELAILRSELELKRDPARVELIPALVRNLVRTGDYASAVRWAGDYRGSVSLQMELGKALWALGRNGEAIRAFETASREGVHRISAEVGLFVLTRDAAHWTQVFAAERAEKDLFVLARLEPVLKDANPRIKALAWRYASVFDAALYHTAAREASAALEKQPGDPELLISLGTAYQRIGKPDDATRYFNQAAAAAPNLAEPVARLAGAAIAAGDGARAVELLERAVRMAPQHAGNLYNLGWLYDQMGDRQKAADFYNRAIAASPLSFEAMNNLALILADTGQMDRARTLLDQAVRTDAESVAAYFNLGNFNARLRDLRSALASYDRVISLDPSNSAAYLEKARVLLELGRTDDAMASLHDCLEIDGSFSDAYALLADAFERSGRRSEAVAALEEVLRIKPGNAEVQARIDRLKGQTQ